MTSLVRPTPGDGFADPHYARIARLIYDAAGIVLGPEKISMMQSRLVKRIAATGCPDLGDYLGRLDRSELPDEMGHLVSALTTNFTHFFREGHHFDFLRTTVFNEQTARLRPVKIWSAGCSSGQEPYSIALTAHQAGARVAITATDIDHAILARAERGVFGPAEISGIPPELLTQGFVPCADGYEVRHPIRDAIRFQHLNLHAAWPFEQTFDVIFCRNTIIYFDPPAQRRLWQRFTRQLRPGGWLLIGHSERIADDIRGPLCPVGQTIYQYLPS